MKTLVPAVVAAVDDVGCRPCQLRACRLAATLVAESHDSDDAMAAAAAACRAAVALGLGKLLTEEGRCWPSL